MPVSSDQFRQALVASGIASAEEIEAVVASLSPAERPADGEGLAKLLIARGLLTAFQAKQVLAGRGASLVLGDYVLLAEIGAGGMGHVYKAKHRRMNRTVALKVMTAAAMRDADAVKRFQREVKAAARLEHPNIVTAYDSGEAGNVKYLVMQFVDGGDLSSLVKSRGRLPIEEAVEYTLQAAEGLAFAHGEGVIHRDIKPANLLLDKKGVVRILDMGLARFEDAGDGLTATEQVMGTVDYMSPEQASDTKHADRRSDIYSLGCTLWYLLTGTKLYEADTLISRLMKHREAPLPSLVKTVDEAPWALEQVLHKMIAKRPQDRYQQMDDVVAALTPLAGRGSRGGSASSSGGGDRPSAELAAFMQSVGPKAGGSSTKAATKSSTTLAPDATEAFQRSEADTDSQRRAPLTGDKSSSRVSTRTSAGAGGKVKLIAAAAAIVVLGGTAAILLRGEPEQLPEVAAAGVAITPAPVVEPQAPRRAVAPFDAAQAKAHQQAWADYLGTTVETTNAAGVKLVLIPPGEYVMGATEAELRAFADAEIPAADREHYFEGMLKSVPNRPATITRPFRLAARETTFGEFEQFIKSSGYVPESEANPGKTAGWQDNQNYRIVRPEYTWRNVGYPTTPEHAVGGVTWRDAVEYCNWLSKRESLRKAYTNWAGVGLVFDMEADGYRLPTEMEWEFACRAGTTTRRYWGDDRNDIDNRVWHAGNARMKIQPVGLKPANPFGLFDMLGNSSEYCHDFFRTTLDEPTKPAVDDFGPASGSVHATRSGVGSPIFIASYLRKTFSAPDHTVGFRVLRPITSIPATAAANVSAPPLDPEPAPSPSATATAMPTSPQAETASVVALLEATNYSWSPPENLGPTINSPQVETSPTLSADELVLIFSSNRDNPAYDFFECRRTSATDPFGPPQKIELPASASYKNYPCLSADGLTLVYSTSQKTGPVHLGSNDFYSIRRESRNAPWLKSTIANLGSVVNSPKEENGASLSPDGLTLAFSSTRASGGGSDFYVSRRAARDAPFGPPQSLGSHVNSAGYDSAPHVLADNKTVLFYRDQRLWMTHLGGTGILIAVELPGDTQGFDHPALSLDGRTLYFTGKSLPGGVGDADIWLTRRVERTKTP